ncbi:MAG: zinc ribbon domain-containing protein [Lachnospiraceae bacterium]|nr:zinc ribbon domain-containing protein [Lachnospiraceae bacterium]
MKNSRMNPQGRCMYCGATIFYQDEYCRACGKENDAWEVPGERQCGNCHESLKEGDAYCRYCGTKAGEGDFEPYQNFHACIYGPEPEWREHKCVVCGYTWSNCAMIDEQRYCPKCGGAAPAEGDDSFLLRGEDIV